MICSELTTLFFGPTLDILWTSLALPYEPVYWEIASGNVYCQFLVRRHCFDVIVLMCIFSEYMPALEMI